jgi:glycerol-3-phosphate cytidylyltransferase
MNRTVIYTTGVFDILHLGHINILREASRLGDRLIVGVQDDYSVWRSKGKRPILNMYERMEQIKALPFVYDVIMYTGTDQIPYYEMVQPNVVVQGSDWEKSGDRTELLQYLKRKNIDLIIYPYTEKISSTEIKRRVIEANRQPVANLVK